MCSSRCKWSASVEPNKKKTLHTRQWHSPTATSRETRSGLALPLSGTVTVLRLVCSWHGRHFPRFQLRRPCPLQSLVLKHDLTYGYLKLDGSPRAHLRVVGILRFMSDINQLSLPTPFYSVSVSSYVLLALSTVFHSIHSPNNSPFSHSVLLHLPVLSLP